MPVWLPDTPVNGLDSTPIPPTREAGYRLRDAGYVDGLSPEPHAIRTLAAFGDLYAVCSCGARSRPYVAMAYLMTWRCPRAEAEAAVLKAQQRWDARVREMAQMDPRD